MTTSEGSNSDDNKECLNCGVVLSGVYCSQCGQAFATGRMSFGRLFAQDFLVSIFNFNRGFFRSCVDLIVRPGELVTNYLSGKRKSYFHFAGMLIILLAIDALLASVAVNSELTVIQHSAPGENPVVDAFTTKGYERMYDFYKFILAFITPLIALVPYFLFRKLGYYYAEHVVIAWFYLAYQTLFSFIFRFVGLLPMGIETFNLVMFPLTAITLFVSLRFYWSLSGDVDYGTWTRVIRVTISGVINMAIIGAVPMYVASALSS